MAAERTVTLDEGTYKWVITVRTSINPACEDWLSVSREDAQAGDEDQVRRLGIDLSLAHPFSAEFLGANNENVELFLRIATAVSISLLLSEDTTGEPPESVLYHFNYLLRGALIRASMRANDNLNNYSENSQTSASMGS